MILSCLTQISCNNLMLLLLLLLYYEKTLLHMTHCFSFMVQQMMMPMGKMRTASATPSGG